MYTATPKQRIKLRDMYVWKNEEETIKSEIPDEALTSGTDGDEDEIDFALQNRKTTKKTKRRT